MKATFAEMVQGMVGMSEDVARMLADSQERVRVEDEIARLGKMPFRMRREGLLRLAMELVGKPGHEMVVAALKA